MKSISREIQSKYRFSNNTFVHTAKNEKQDKIEVEIGDSKQPDFKPQFKVMRWDNEVNFSVRAKEHDEARVEFDGEKIKYITTEYEVHQYDRPDISEDGGFEFEWVLPKKPIKNTFTATIQSKGLSFFYQGELTEEELKMGRSRPENIIGSYAIYSTLKRINYVGGKIYGTGKVGHIYRPKAVDAKGKETWAELNIKDGILSVIVPRDFLDKATYPVTVDPTFGNDTVGGTNGTYSNTVHPFCSLYNTLVAVTGDEITQYSLYAANSGSSPSVEIAAYSVVSGAAASRLTTALNLSVSSSTPQWWNTGVVSHSLVNGVEYGVAFGNWNFDIKLYTDDPGFGTNIDYEDTDAALPATWGRQTTYRDILSVYAIYKHRNIDINYSYNIFIDKGKL